MWKCLRFGVQISSSWRVSNSGQRWDERGGVEWVVKGETKAMRIVCMERGVKDEQESGEQGVSLLAAWGSPSTHSLLP